jgi:hypothetical protein
MGCTKRVMPSPRAIGRVIEDESKGIYLPRQKLVRRGKEFREE